MDKKIENWMKKYKLTLKQRGLEKIYSTALSRKSPINITNKCTGVPENIEIYHFVHESEGNRIRGLVSHKPSPKKKPLIIWNRGGNNALKLEGISFSFGAIWPTNLTKFSEEGDFIVVGTNYRGGISEGSDEFGGSEVADVKSLFDHLSVLESKISGLNIDYDNIYMGGASRGVMQTILFLNKYTEYQKKIKKIFLNCGFFDSKFRYLRREFENRVYPDAGWDGKSRQWLKERDPIKKINNIRKDLPMLIMIGGKDPRCAHQGGINFYKKLKSNGHKFLELYDVPNGNHCLRAIILDGPDLRGDLPNNNKTREMIQEQIKLQDNIALMVKNGNAKWRGKKTARDIIDFLNK